jgi:hypothetical protein
MKLRRTSLLAMGLLAGHLAGHLATAQTAQTAPPAPMASVAATPPMGWNSWDSFGLTITEDQFRANVAVLARQLKPFGYNTAVIDEGWFFFNPEDRPKPETLHYAIDANGRYVPVPGRFPSVGHPPAASAGASDAAPKLAATIQPTSFKALADWVHSQGLKFGIHIVRGIPRQVVKDNLPIAGTSFHAQDAADIPATCPWDEGNYGVSDTPAGQAYYDGMMKLYASWGLDFIKVDCISDHPYRPTEISQIAESIRKTGRPIVLSLSPGPTSLDHAAEVAKYSQMWRITDDHWDVWASKRQENGSEFPFGLRQEFDRIADWQQHVGPDSWPDPDMLPEGTLTPHPGWGEARKSHYTYEEQETEFVLWSISRSPLIFGGNLTKLGGDDRMHRLMTSKDVIDINQKSIESHPVKSLPPGFENIRVWVASETKGDEAPQFVAIFNIGEKAEDLHATWAQLGLPMIKQGKMRSLLGPFGTIKASELEGLRIGLPAHGSMVIRVENDRSSTGK